MQGLEQHGVPGQQATSEVGVTLPAGAGEKQVLYTDHVDSEVTCHCLQGLERQGVTISDNALVRHNLVVFRNGDSAMQVSMDLTCLLQPFGMQLGRPNTQQSPH